MFGGGVQSSSRCSRNRELLDALDNFELLEDAVVGRLEAFGDEISEATGIIVVIATPI